MTRHDMLKLYGKGKRRNPKRAFEIAIKKFSELHKHIADIQERGSKSQHWPSWKNCAMCHHADVGPEGFDCKDGDCIIKGKGLCGLHDADTYELIVAELKAKNWATAMSYANVMALQLAVEYIRYLTKHKGILK